jgi:glutamyl-tRNA synthetase
MDVFEFDHLITKRKLEENEELKNFVNRNSKVQYTLVGEGVMKNLQKGTVI